MRCSAGSSHGREVILSTKTENCRSGLVRMHSGCSRHSAPAWRCSLKIVASVKMWEAVQLWRGPTRSYLQGLQCKVCSSRFAFEWRREWAGQGEGYAQMGPRASLISSSFPPRDINCRVGRAGRQRPKAQRSSSHYCVMPVPRGSVFALCTLLSRGFEGPSTQHRPPRTSAHLPLGSFWRVSPYCSVR